jgi:hypothetical protein
MAIQTMASRLVVLRERVVNSLQAAFSAWGDTLTTAVVDRVQPFLQDGENAFDLPLLQRLLQRMVAASYDGLILADKGRVDELTADIQPRLERDRWIDGVRQKLIEIRRISDGLFGRQRTVEIVAVDGTTAREPELLWRQAEHTLSRLRSPDLQLPQASTAAVTFDAAALAAELEPLVTGLRGAIDAVKLDEQQTVETLQAKQEAMVEHDLLMGACKGILSGFCLLARRPDLARRLRISLPRPRPGASDGATPTGEVPEPPTETEPAVNGGPAAE